MEDKTLQALKWLVNILDNNGIPYRIGGGVAAHVYGSGRSINDIDVSLEGKYFGKLVSLIEEHVVAGPKHYQNEKWDCTTLSLDYNGQDIDLTDSDTLLMRDKENTKWIENKTIYKKHPDVVSEVDGVKVSLMHPRVLVEYKKELSGEHQQHDIDFLEKYIEENNL